MVKRTRGFFFAWAIAAFCLTGLGYVVFGWPNSAGLPHYIEIWSSGSALETSSEYTGWFSDAFKRDYNVILHGVYFPDEIIRYSDNEITVSNKVMSGKTDYAMVGMTGSYGLQEGLPPYGKRGQGPQPVRLVLQNHAPQLRTLLVNNDSSITSVSDLNGKRVAWAATLPDINYLTVALLRYGNVPFDKVRFVHFASPEEALQALLDKKVDAAFSPSRERFLFNVSKNSFPFRYLPMPDGAGWKAVHEVAPFFKPIAGTLGAGLSSTAPDLSAGYAFPVIITHPETAVDYVARFVDALLATAPGQVIYSAGMAGWSLDNLPLDWQIPYHQGAIEVFKKHGLWPSAYQAYNDRLIERQRILSDAWKALKSDNYTDNDALQSAWLVAREKALRDAGFSVGFVPSNEAAAIYGKPY